MSSVMPQSPASLDDLAIVRPDCRLILGSSSPYRKALLDRLGLPFKVVAPQVDEAVKTGETPAKLASRLAQAKALAVARGHPNAIVIGSDQVADLDGQALGKPGTHARAMEQLLEMSGRTVVFHTAVCLIRLDSNFKLIEIAQARVRFRQLARTEIDDYLRSEQPYDCAGSAKSEGLGIALLDSIESDDPTTLIGLPLIRTCRMLRMAGVKIP